MQGHPPLGPKKYTQEEYLAIAKGQLREIIAMFGDEGPVEIWCVPTVLWLSIVYLYWNLCSYCAV